MAERRASDSQLAHVEGLTTQPAVIRWGLAPVRWVVGPLATILIASFALFVGLSFAPGDPVTVMLGMHATPQARAMMRRAMGLDHPLVVQYWHWLTGVIRGHFGLSIVYRANVSTVMAGRAPTTFLLVAYAAVIVIVVGVGLGIIGGVSRRLGPGVSAFTAVCVGVPSYVAALWP